MKIALIGSHCVGKTTLIEPVSKALNLPVIPEAARDWCDRHRYDNISKVENVDAMQWDILHAQIAQESNHDQFISDRSTLDGIAYFVEFGLTHKPNDYKAMALAHAKRTYDLLFFIPIQEKISLVDDGFRYEDLQARKRIEDLILATTTMAQLDPFTIQLDTLSVEDRVQEIVKACEYWRRIRKSDRRLASFSTVVWSKKQKTQYSENNPSVSLRP